MFFRSFVYLVFFVFYVGLTIVFVHGTGPIMFSLRLGTPGSHIVQILGLNEFTLLPTKHTPKSSKGFLGFLEQNSMRPRLEGGGVTPLHLALIQVPFLLRSLSISRQLANKPYGLNQV